MFDILIMLLLESLNTEPPHPPSSYEDAFIEWTGVVQ